MRVERKVITAPGEGARLPNLRITHKVTAKDSGGSLVVDEWVLSPGEMIPPHTHAREDECSHVLAGELTCYVGGEVVVAPAGSYVLKPRGIPHAFYNASSEAVRVMEILTPGDRFEGYFDEYERMASDDERNVARAELGERYGITWRDDLVPEAEARLRAEDQGETAGSAREAAGSGGVPERGNEAVVRRYVEECWNGHDIDASDELVSPDYLNHAASPGYRRAGARYNLTWIFSVFPDHRFDIEDAAADGDTVAVRGTMVGTHEGDLVGIAPTGKRVAVQQTHWFRVREGKIAEHWAVRDDLGMMRQLGIVADPD